MVAMDCFNYMNMEQAEGMKMASGFSKMFSSENDEVISIEERTGSKRAHLLVIELNVLHAYDAYERMKYSFPSNP